MTRALARIQPPAAARPADFPRRDVSPPRALRTIRSGLEAANEGAS
jgi:hypothetical protein